MLCDAVNLANLTLLTALLLVAVDAKNAPNSVANQDFVSSLVTIGRDFVPLEEYRERVRI